MNFDGLEDQLDIGYTPTIASNSRSAGMKKLNRKQQAKPTVSVNTKKNDDFDFLDDLLASPAKPVSKSVDKAKSTSFGQKNSNEVDSFFDEPTIPLASKPTGSSKIESSVTTKSVSKPPVVNMIEDNILEQNEPKGSSFKLKRPQVPPPPAPASTPTYVPPKKEEEPDIIINPSSRMMKPPLRKRESKEDLGKAENSKSMAGLGMGLMLPDEPSKSIAQKEDDSKFKPVNLGNRRSSIEMNSSDSLHLNVDPVSKNKIDGNNFGLSNSGSQDKLNLFKTFDNQKQKEYKSYQQSKQQLTLQPKKQQKKSLWDSQKSVEITNHHKSSEPYNRTPLLQPYVEPSISTNPYLHSHGQAGQVGSPGHQSLDAQVEYIKKSYQSHISSLQKSLDEQIRSNKETRDKLIKESNVMIDNERARLKKMHEEELDRLKAISDWEKKKIQEQYRYEVDGLKVQLERVRIVAQDEAKGRAISQADRRDIQYLQDKLKNERKILDDRIKLLDKRELDLEEREKEFNRRKRNEEERLRNEERRIMQYEMDIKKQLLDQKRSLEEEKQQMASQLVTLEMGNYRKNENVEQLKSQLQRQGALLEAEKNEIHKMNNTMVLEYQRKCEQLKIQKQKVQRLESEMIGKIKVVESTRQRLNTTMQAGVTKENNWVHGNSTLQTNQEIRPMSVEKQTQMKKVETTQNRFREMTANMKESFRMGNKGRDFDLDNYLMNMAKYTRGREGIH